MDAVIRAADESCLHPTVPVVVVVVVTVIRSQSSAEPCVYALSRTEALPM